MAASGKGKMGREGVGWEHGRRRSDGVRDFGSLYPENLSREKSGAGMLRWDRWGRNRRSTAG